MPAKPAPPKGMPSPLQAEAVTSSELAKQKGGLFFEGFHELRALAALAVVMHHIELMKSREGLPSLFNTSAQNFILYLGKNGVYLFFVLSGFLITYLLLAEMQTLGKVNIKAFYTRRVLRIWPLYLLFIFLAFVLVPLLPTAFPILKNVTSYDKRILGEGAFLWQAFPYYLLFLINFCRLPPVVGASQAWSVSVEEQFYIFWPWLILLFRKWLPLAFIGLIAAMKVGPGLLPISTKNLYALVDILYYTRFDMMALGGLMAWAVFRYRAKADAILGHTLVGWGFLALTLPLLWLGNKPMPISICFAVLIGHIALKGRRIPAFGLLRNAGEISYGLYMVHSMAIYIVLAVLMEFALPYSGSVGFHVALYGFTILMAWGLAWVSYRFFEKPFLRLKKTFERVRTGQEAP